MDGELGYPVYLSVKPLYARPTPLIIHRSYKLRGLCRPGPASRMEVLETKQGIAELSPYLAHDQGNPGNTNPHHLYTGFDAASYHADV